MKLRIPAVVQDPLIIEYKGLAAFENVELEEDFFLDGPIGPRVAILDFDEKGALHPGVPFVPPKPGNKIGTYAVQSNDPHDRAANAVSVFATVAETIRMFEDRNALGRAIRWAFDAPQLLVIPRAGRDANAFYERESHSLQFFSFPSASRAGAMIHTSLSRDIIAHETGHAVLDGVAPDLYHASTPQGLALHEAIADLTAMLSGFSSDELRPVALAQSGNRIDIPNAFNWVAEEFGRERDPERGKPLRSLLNDKNLDPKDAKNRVDASDPHALSEVLSGALYRMMIDIYRSIGKTTKPAPKALAIAATRFRRMAYRALDYLPPGEISFADYARALIASDEASHPDEAGARKTIAAEFLRRKIVRAKKELEVPTSFRWKPAEEVDLGTLCASEWAAYDFANRHRDFLGVPKKIHFRVLPRLDSTKSYFHREGEEQVRECIFKVTWDEIEPNPLGPRFPPRRQITAGTTLAIDWETRRVRALAQSRFADQRTARDAFLRRLADEGLLRVGAAATGPDGKPLRSVIRAEASDGLMRLRASGRYLHLAGEQR